MTKQETLAANIEKIKSLLKVDKPTAEQEAEIEKLEKDNEVLADEIAAEKKRSDRLDKIAKQENWLAQSAGRKTDDNAIATRDNLVADKQMPAYSQKRRFENARFEKLGMDVDQAYDFAQWFLATQGIGQAKCDALRYCEKHDYLASQTETVAGYLVPTILSGNIIIVRQKYGVARQNSLVVPMPSSKFNYPTAVTPVQAYWNTISTAASEQVEVFGTATLTANKLSCLVRVPNELILDRDSVVDLGGLLAYEFGYAWALKEDQTMFLADGTNSGTTGYGGFTGIISSLNAASTIGAASGHTGAPTLTLSDFESVVGAYPYYGQEGDVAWYVSKPFWAASMLRLAAAAGGNTIRTIEQGSEIQFLGYPVRFTQVLDNTITANASATQVLFGDLRRATILGDRRTFQMKTSDQVRFAEDETVFLGTSRIAIAAHMGGVPTGTIGPIVSLKNAAS